MDAQDEMVRLLAIQVRTQFENQAEAIREFDRAGSAPRGSRTSSVRRPGR